MDAMERRVFLKGASMGLLSFTVGGADILMTAGEARARAVPFRLLNGEEAETLEALGEALVPGAREASVAHFIDQHFFPVAARCGESGVELGRDCGVKPVSRRRRDQSAGVRYALVATKRRTASE